MAMSHSELTLRAPHETKILTQNMETKKRKKELSMNMKRAPKWKSRKRAPR